MKSMTSKLKQVERKFELKKTKLEAAKQGPKALVIPDDPVVFAQDFFGFDAKEYQAGLLQDRSKRIVVRWSRQAGKTTCIALRAIWFSCFYPKTCNVDCCADVAAEHDYE